MNARGPLSMILVVVNLVVFLGTAAWIVADKGDHLAHGRKLWLEVTKYDPRSLMQGDYMALRYPICGEIGAALARDASGDGQAVIRIDADGIGRFVRLHQGLALGPEEHLLYYRVRWGRADPVRVAAEEFLFQEGTGMTLDQALYAELRLRADGRTLLVALCGRDLRPLGR